MKRFHVRCDVQREILLAIINKTLFSLLAFQERVIATLNLPFACFQDDTNIVLVSVCNATDKHSMGFSVNMEKKLDGRVVDMMLEQKRILCALLSLRYGERMHRAFIPENTVPRHVQQQQQYQQQTVGVKRPLVEPVRGVPMASAVPSLPAALDGHNVVVPALPALSATAAAAGMSGDGSDLQSPTSLDGSEGGTTVGVNMQTPLEDLWNVVFFADLNDYYSIEAKKRRKKRRIQSGSGSGVSPHSPFPYAYGDESNPMDVSGNDNSMDDSFTLESAATSGGGPTGSDFNAKIDDFFSTLDADTSSTTTSIHPSSASTNTIDSLFDPPQTQQHLHLQHMFSAAPTLAASGSQPLHLQPQFQQPHHQQQHQQLRPAVTLSAEAARAKLAPSPDQVPIQSRQSLQHAPVAASASSSGAGRSINVVPSKTIGPNVGVGPSATVAPTARLLGKPVTPLAVAQSSSASSAVVTNSLRAGVARDGAGFRTSVKDIKPVNAGRSAQTSSYQNQQGGLASLARDRGSSPPTYGSPPKATTAGPSTSPANALTAAPTTDPNKLQMLGKLASMLQQAKK
jgi:hypothetical protein